MYVIRDSVGPSIKGHVDSLRFKNTILKYWPTTTLGDGTVVFEKLYTWTSSQGVIDDNAHRKIYKIIGIDIADIESQDKDGLTSLYLTVSGMDTSVVVTNAEVREYIEQFTPQIYPNNPDVFNPNTNPSPLTDLNPDPYKNGDIADPDDGEFYEPLWDKDGWITSYLTYMPMNDSLINPNISDAEILSKCSGYHPEDITYDDRYFNRLTGVAIMDIDGVLFERELRVLQRTVEERHALVKGFSVTSSVSNYLVSAKVEFKFRRVVDANDVSATTFIDSLVSRVDDINTAVLNPPQVSYGRVDTIKYMPLQLSINKQLIRMANYIMPFTDDGSNYLISEGLPGSYISENNDVAIKYDYLAGLMPKEFVKHFGNHIEPGYTQKKAKWWQKLLVAIITIIVIIIAVVAAVLTGGSSLMMASMVLTAGALVLTGLSMYWAKNGEPGAAAFAGGAAQILGYLAMATGIAAAVQNLATQGAKELALETAKAEVLAAGANATPAMLSAVSAAQAGVLTTTQIAGQVVSIVSQVGSELGVIEGDAANILSLASGALAVSSFGVGIVEIPGIDELQDIVVTGFTRFTAQPTATIMNQTMNTTNRLFSMYMSNINPPTEGIADQAAKIEAQEKEIETLNPEHTEATWKSYTDPYGSIFEVGDVYERSYNMMTSGRNRIAMNKYYESGY